MGKTKVIAAVALVAVFFLIMLIMQPVYASTPTTKAGSKLCIISVSSKYGGNLPGADVYVDGRSWGQTNSRGEVRKVLGYGPHTVKARKTCGGAPRTATKKFTFSSGINGVALTISMCYS